MGLGTAWGGRLACNENIQLGSIPRSSIKYASVIQSVVLLTCNQLISVQVWAEAFRCKQQIFNITVENIIIWR